MIMSMVPFCTWDQKFVRVFCDLFELKFHCKMAVGHNAQSVVTANYFEIDAHFLRRSSCVDALTASADVYVVEDYCGLFAMCIIETADFAQCRYAFGVILWELFVDVNEDAVNALRKSPQ